MPPGQCITTWIWTWTCTVFHSISQNILSKCFVKYCTLISLKWQHCENFGLLPAMLAHWRIPTATMLTPGRGRLPGASLLRLRLLMMLTAASHCRQSLDGVRWCEIVRDPISILLYYVRDPGTATLAAAFKTQLYNLTTCMKMAGFWKTKCLEMSCAL